MKRNFQKGKKNTKKIIFSLKRVLTLPPYPLTDFTDSSIWGNDILKVTTFPLKKTYWG